MSLPDDVRSKLAEELEKAQPAGSDTEYDLNRLESLARQMAVDPFIKAEYEELRDKLRKQLTKEGPRIFAAPDGKKYLAYPVNPEGVEIDEAALNELETSNVLTEEQLEKLAPRKVDKQVFARFVANGTLPRDVVAKIARVVPKTGHVRMQSVDSLQDDED